jgi:hypothetical protein
MNRIAVEFPMPCGGYFSHFAHFICDFALPFYSLLRKELLLDSLLAGQERVLELEERPNTMFGPILPLVCQIFPGVRVQYVRRFTVEPVRFDRTRWHNDPKDVDSFIQYLKKVLPLKPLAYGVVIVRRGTDRRNYPGTELNSSGADRRTISAGFEELVADIRARRPDTIDMELEHLPLVEQISLFLNADTLIAQHGAAFVHSQWMPRGGWLIELQCSNHPLARDFVWTLAKLREHRHLVVYYPCEWVGKSLTMHIADPKKVSRLVTSKRAVPLARARHKVRAKLSAALAKWRSAKGGAGTSTKS